MANTDNSGVFDYTPKHRDIHPADFNSADENFDILTKHHGLASYNREDLVKGFPSDFNDQSKADYYHGLAHNLRHFASDPQFHEGPEDAANMKDAASYAHALGQHHLGAAGLTDSETNPDKGSSGFIISTDNHTGDATMDYQPPMNNSIASSTTAHNIANIIATSRRGRR